MKRFVKAIEHIQYEYDNPKEARRHYEALKSKGYIIAVKQGLKITYAKEYKTRPYAGRF